MATDLFVHLVWCCHYHGGYAVLAAQSGSCW
jgi:hypothetical protein